MSDTTTTTTAASTPESASQIFQQVAGLFASNIFTNALPVITNAIAAIESNPQTVLNPANAVIFGAQFVANINATLPTIEASALTSAVQMLQAIISTVQTDVTSAVGTTSATSVGQNIANAIAAKL